MTDDLHGRLKQLAVQKVNQLTQSFTTEKKRSLKEFFYLFEDDITVFERLYQAYRDNLSSLEIQHRQETLSYEKHGTMHTLTFLNKQVELDADHFTRLLSRVIDILREMLPLGSVVELDPDYFKPNDQMDSPVKVVIKGRFIAPEDFNSYFPYAGVIYPLGEVRPDTTVHFTAPLIRRVMHRGFKDELDETYEILMKREFIIDKDMCSIAFSDTDMKRLQQEMKIESR